MFRSGDKKMENVTRIREWAVVWGFNDVGREFKKRTETSICHVTLAVSLTRLSTTVTLVLPEVVSSWGLASTTVYLLMGCNMTRELGGGRSVEAEPRAEGVSDWAVPRKVHAGPAPFYASASQLLWGEQLAHHLMPSCLSLTSGPGPWKQWCSDRVESRLHPTKELRGTWN